MLGDETDSRRGGRRCMAVEVAAARHVTRTEYNRMVEVGTGAR